MQFRSSTAHGYTFSMMTLEPIHASFFLSTAYGVKFFAIHLDTMQSHPLSGRARDRIFLLRSFLARTRLVL